MHTLLPNSSLFCLFFPCSQIYPKIAIYLNYMELHRTQYEFQQALAVKIYVFRFINTYSALLYTALFKGKFIGHPGNYYRIFGVRQEEVLY